MSRSVLVTSMALVLWGCASPSPDLEQSPQAEGAVQEINSDSSSDERTTEDIRLSEVGQDSAGSDQGSPDLSESTEMATVDTSGSDIRIVELTELEKAAVMDTQKLLDSLAESKAAEGVESATKDKVNSAEIPAPTSEVNVSQLDEKVDSNSSAGQQGQNESTKGLEFTADADSEAAQGADSDRIEKPITNQSDQVSVSKGGEEVASAQELRTRDENVFRSKYKLGTGDVISIRVFNEPDLSMERVRMTEAGSIQYVILGEINIAGLTTREVETLVENKLLDGYLRNPKVTVSVDEYRPYFIGGEVVKRGSYPYVPGMTVLKAITIAGGFAPRASKSKIFLSPEGMPEDKRKVTEDDPIAPGDIITVEESFF